MNKEEKKIIEISSEDLKDDKDKIVIENSDLKDIVEDKKIYPKINDTFSPEIPKGKKITREVFYSSSLMQNIVAGLIGGILGWIITELFYDDYMIAHKKLFDILIEMGIFGGIIGGCIGLFLGAIEGIVCRVREKILRGGAIGLYIGFIGGAIGGVIGQIIYGLLGGGGAQNIGLQIFIRTVAWSLVGLPIGVSYGLVISSRKKIINGLIGGVIGGAIGGFLFDPISFIFNSGVISRAVGISIIGTSIGLGIGIVEEIRKQAWLIIEKGFLSGKQFILYNEITTIGSSPKCDIVLFIKDSNVSLIHSIIKIENNKYVIYDNNSISGTFVNNQRINKKILSNNDYIQIGNTIIRFLER